MGNHSPPGGFERSKYCNSYLKLLPLICSVGVGEFRCVIMK